MPPIGAKLSSCAASPRESTWWLTPSDEATSAKVMSADHRHGASLQHRSLADALRGKGAILRVAPINDRGELMLDEFEKLLNPRTQMVAVVHVSNALGHHQSRAEMVAMAHRHGVPVIVDGAQAAPHIHADVQASRLRFLFALSGHKMFAPTGIGVLYGKKDLLDKMPPYQGGGDMIRTVTFAKTTYADCRTSLKRARPTSPAPSAWAPPSIMWRTRNRKDRRHEHDLLSLRHTLQLGTYPGTADYRHGARKGQRAVVRGGRHPPARS
jgi:hypothetical protein